MTNFVGRYREQLKRIRDGEFDDAPDEEKTRAVQDLIRTSATTAAAAALQPIPFADTAVLLPIHVGLVRAVGRLRGYDVETKQALEIMWTCRANMLTQHSLMAAAKFVPYVGWIVAVSTAHALTYSLGAVVDLFFLRDRQMPSDELRTKLKSLYKKDFERVYRQRRNELRAKLGRAPEVRRKLREIDQQHRAGRIDDREKQRRKEWVLDRA